MTFDLSMETPAEKARRVKGQDKMVWTEICHNTFWAKAPGGVYNLRRRYESDNSRLWELSYVNSAGIYIWTRVFVWKMEAKKAAADDYAAMSANGS